MTREPVALVLGAFPQVEPANCESPAFQDAVRAYLKGDRPKALDSLGRSAVESPVTHEARLERLFLVCLLDIGAAEFEAAIRSIEELRRAAKTIGSARFEAMASLLLGAVENDRGHLGYAQNLLERSYAQLTPCGTLWDLARAKYYLGRNSLAQGRVQLGEEQLEAGLHLAKVSRSQFLEALILNRLGVRELTIGRYDSAARRYAQAEELLAALGADRKLAQLNFSKAVLFITKGDLGAARAAVEVAYEKYYASAEPIPAARWKQVVGWLELRSGNAVAARTLLNEAREALQTLGAQRDEALTYEFLGDLASIENEQAQARKMYERGLELGRMASVTSDVVAECLRKLGELYVRTGHLADAIRMARTAQIVGRTCLDRLESAALHRLRGLVAHQRGKHEYGLELLYLARAEFAALPARIEEQETAELIRSVCADRDQSLRKNHAADATSAKSGLIRKSVAQDGIKTGDPRVLRAHDLTVRAAPSRLPVLILGETGSGKELLAAAVHRHSGRSGPFLTINCAALPPDILDGELFGSVRGAFTGALRDRAGLIEAASGGTLFLDEVGEMSPAVQGRLLRAIELGEVRRLGENRTRKVDTRFVSATHRDLEKMVHDGEFRADLFFRLRGIVVTVPPLRERLGDVDLLTDHFLKNDPRGAALTLSTEARQKLLSHAWPGNVRELKSVLERVIELSAEGAVIHPEDLGLEPIRVAGSLAEHLEAEERRRVIATLESLNWNRSRAAKALNMKRTTFLSKLRRLGITGPARH